VVAVTRPTPRAPQLVVRRSTSVLTAGLAVAGALALSGCQLTSPQQTMMPYQPADGVDVTLGSVTVNDLVVISSAKGQQGVLSGQVANTGGQPATVTISAPGAPAVTKRVGPYSMTRLSGEPGTTPATLPSVSVEPGSLMNLTIGTSSAGSNVVGVPVLEPSLYYSTVTPAGPSGSPTTSATPTQTSSARTPEPTRSTIPGR
jgi:hypothetical protein